MKKEIIYLDLFSGIGGFAKGFQDAGVNIKKHYFSEIDNHAIAVYKHNFKNSEYAGDVRFISKGTIKDKPNVITFGFPCQDLSVAGKGEGLSGSRSGLFFEAIRIIKELKPEVFIFENVKGLLSSNEGKDFELVLRTIANIGLYGCEWQLVNTAWVLPQNRERVYFVGHLTGKSRPEVFPFTKADFRIIEGKPETTTVRTITAGGHSGGHHSGMTLVKNLQGKEICNTIRSGGKGSLTKKHNWDIIQINDKQNFGKSTKQPDRVYSANEIMACLSKDSRNNITVKPILTPDRKNKRQNGRRFKENGEPAFTLNTQDQHGIMIQKGRGFNKGGEKDICPTISANSFEQNNFVKDTTIRRLTEIECERLQGFPDNWTKYGNYDGIIKEVAKTQRYKQLGNAVTTDIPRMIAERLTIFNKTL